MSNQLFHSAEDLHRFMKRQTVQVAHDAGFDTEQHEEAGSTLYGKHGSDEVITIYSNGSWEVWTAGVQKMTGGNAMLLGYYLAGNEKMFDEVFKES